MQGDSDSDSGDRCSRRQSSLRVWYWQPPWFACWFAVVSNSYCWAKQRHTLAVLVACDNSFCVCVCVCVKFWSDTSQTVCNRSTLVIQEGSNCYRPEWGGSEHTNWHTCQVSDSTQSIVWITRQVLDNISEIVAGTQSTWYWPCWVTQTRKNNRSCSETWWRVSESNPWQWQWVAVRASMGTPKGT